MIEQKLEEITKKIEEMNDTQKNITDTINQNPLDSNIKPMINTQNNNLENIEKTMEEAESLINKTDQETANKINDIRTGETPKEIKKEMKEILNNQSNNQESMNKSSNDIESNINEMMQEMESIISSYKKKENLEMLVKYIRIIKMNGLFQSFPCFILILYILLFYVLIDEAKKKSMRKKNRKMIKILNQVAEKYKNEIKFATVNVRKYEDKMNALGLYGGIDAVPCSAINVDGGKMYPLDQVPAGQHVVGTRR